MGTLAQLWQQVILGSQRTDIAVFAAQLDQLASGQGYIRPDTIPSPRSFTESDPASRVDGWEAWYNSAPVTQGALPPTNTFGASVATSPAQWSALVAIAAARDVPSVVRAYLAVQGSTWETARPHWQGDGEPLFEAAQRAVQAWWFQRLGGAGGTPAPFPRGDAAGTPTGGAPGVPTSSGGGGDVGKALGILLAAFLLSKRRKR